MSPRIALLALALLTASNAAPQPLPDPFEEEDPATLLDFSIGDAGVSFYALGSWTTGIAPGVGWIVSGRTAPERTVTPGYQFPGLEPIPYFNRPDMTLSLWLLERYFFETSIAEDLDQSTILLGYEGREGESVRSVLIGNTGIGIGRYPYLGFGDVDPAGGRNAPGMSAAFETPWSEHELMVLFAAAEKATIRYAGGGIVSESRIAAIDYEQDQHFVLPDGNLDFLKVHVETGEGGRLGSDGRRYRTLDLHREASFSLSDGTLSFETAPGTRVVVYYESGGVPVGDPSLGSGAFFGLDADGTPDPGDRRDFSYATLDTTYAPIFDPDGAHGDFLSSDFTVTIDGEEGFLLHQPGRYAPFAVAAIYRSEEIPATIVLETPEGRPVDSALRFIRAATRNQVILQGTDPDPRAFENRYPLASARVENPVPRLYGPAPTTPPRTPELVLRSVSPTTRIVLPGDFVPGSVRITRNGTRETAFSVRSDGEIVFDRPLQADDVVVVEYRAASAAELGDLLFAIGNRFRLAPGTSAELALGGRWTPPGQEFSTRPGEYPGTLTLSGAIRTDSREWDSDPPRAPRGELRAELRGAVSLSSADTSGALRIAGMNEASRMIPIVPTALFAAPPPVTNPIGPSQPLAPSRRGRLYYRDFYDTTLVGGRTLLPYDLDPLPSRFPYDEGGRTGPYPALSTDDDYSGTAAVLEYEMDEAHTWVAGLLRVDGGRGTDLSTTRTLIVPYRVLEATGESELHLQIGAIGEDLDGDGVIDVGSRGLPFRDEAAGVTLLTGTIPPPGVTYTEDATGSGVLDRELADMVLTRKISPVATPGGWAEPAIFEITAAEARQLQETRAVRFLLTSADGQAASGRVLVGAIEAQGSAFSVRHPVDRPDPARVYVRERRHGDPADDEAPLSEAFPEVASRFSEPGVDPHLLSVRWFDLAPGEQITISRAAAVPAADYRALRLYYRPADLSKTWPETAGLILRARSDASTVAEGSVPLVAAGWRELEVPIPADAGAIITTIDVVIEGASEGEILIDEMSMWDPRSTAGAIAELELGVRPDVTVNLGDLDLLSNVSLDQRLLLETTSYAGDAGSTRSGLESSTDLGADVLGVHARIGLDLQDYPNGTGTQVRHELRVPLSPLSLTLRDTFRSTYGTFGSGLSHAASLTFASGRFDLSGQWRRATAENEQNEWRATAGFGSRPTEPERLELSATAASRLTETRFTPLPVAAYPQAWLESFSHALPVESPDRRAVSAVLRGSAGTGAAGLDVHAAAGVRVDSSTIRRTVDLEYGVGIPLQLPAGEIALRLSRETVLVDEAVPLPSPTDDIRSAGLLTAAYPVGYALWPIAELLSETYPSDTADLTDGLIEASYRPQIGLEYRRRVSSSPWSLIAPSTARLSAARPAMREEDSASSIYEIRADALAVAPNLFGRLGSHPVVGFYDTDEFQTGLRVTARGGDGASWTSRIGVDQTIRLAWVDNRTLRLENVLSVAVPSENSASLTSRLIWKRRLPGVSQIPIPLPARLKGLDPATEIETTVEIDYSQGTTSTLISRLERSRTLVFGRRGSIRLHGGLGAGTRETDGEHELLFGVRAGLEGRLEL